jgi:hypothetical protein
MFAAAEKFGLVASLVKQCAPLVPIGVYRSMAALDVKDIGASAEASGAR